MAKPDDQLDIFRACYADIPIRDQRETMERPFFSLAKKPRRTPIAYDVNGTTVTVYPVKEFGIATIWDADVLIWIATQITELIDRGGEPSPTVQFHPYSLLKGVRRHVGGDQYRKLQEALRRLASTYVETNIRVPRGSRKKTVGFHWVEHWDSYEDATGKPLHMSITIRPGCTRGSCRRAACSRSRGLFRPDGWDRALAVPRRPQARRPAGGRLAVHHAPALRQVRQRGPLLRLRPGCAEGRGGQHLPEYTLDLSKNDEGDEIIRMLRRNLLPVNDPRFELTRGKRRRHGTGIRQKALRFT
jgi:hypothetical protein